MHRAGAAGGRSPSSEPGSSRVCARDLTEGAQRPTPRSSHPPRHPATREARRDHAGTRHRAGAGGGQPPSSESGSSGVCRAGLNEGSHRSTLCSSHPGRLPVVGRQPPTRAHENGRHTMRRIAHQPTHADGRGVAPVSNGGVRPAGAGGRDEDDARLPGSAANNPTSRSSKSTHAPAGPTSPASRAGVAMRRPSRGGKGSRDALRRRVDRGDGGVRRRAHRTAMRTAEQPGSRSPEE